MPSSKKNNDETQEREFIFDPKTDITAYDIAKILQAGNLTISESLYRILEPRCRRHFK